VNNSHNMAVGYVLWIFGFTGSHRFYFGKPVSGTIWFCTLGLLGIGWLIDLFLIPGMDRQADLRFTEGRVNYSIAWILLTFLGPFGLHRMYIGKVLTGVAWLAIFGLGSLVGLPFLIFPFLIFDFWTLNDQIAEINTGGQA